MLLLFASCRGLRFAELMEVYADSNLEKASDWPNLPSMFALELAERDFRQYMELIKKFLRQWPKVFTEEFGRVGNLAGGKTGEKFHVVNSRGVELTIEECEDGWVNIHFSDQKNCYSRISIDHLFSKLR